MTRRSTPQAQIDRTAWPVTVRIKIPERGLGVNEPTRWLNAEIGLTEYAKTPNGRGAGVEYHFRSLGDAERFLVAFPMFELDDFTMSPGYSSPHLPFGRRASRNSKP